MELLQGFSWPLQQAFANAVAQCQFAEGDIVHSHKLADTGNWAAEHGGTQKSIQVRFPTRKIGTSGEVPDRQVFKRNWESMVRLDLYETLGSNVARPLVTTQGRLYTALWKNDLSILDIESPKPRCPILASELTNRLSEIETRITSELEGKNYKTAFVMPYDPTNHTLLLKLEALKSLVDGEHLSLIGTKAGFAGAEQIAPTVQIKIILVKDKNHDQLAASIKKAFYKPAKKALKTGKDKFKIARHGMIIG